MGMSSAVLALYRALTDAGVSVPANQEAVVGAAAAWIRGNTKRDMGELIREEEEKMLATVTPAETPAEPPKKKTVRLTKKK